MSCTQKVPDNRSPRFSTLLREIDRHLKVKISSLASFQEWMQGKEAAAKAAHRLQLDVALHVYLRTCFVARSGKYSLNEVVRLLVQIGFHKEDIVERAKSDEFSVFFFAS